MNAIKNATIVYMKLDVEEHNKTLEYVHKVLEDSEINCLACQREKATSKIFEKSDLIIIVGGDGTFLRTAHFFKDQLILGVNSYPAEKEGFFMRSTKEDFKQKLDKIIAGNFKVQKLIRAGCRVNGYELPPAVNEYYFGYPKAYHVARYKILFKSKIERHKSSGILISTPQGSHAWISSAGGEKMNLDRKELQWLVREPYYRKVTVKGNLSKGFLKKGEILKVISEMRGIGVVVADSVEKEYAIKDNDELEFYISDKDLNMVEF